MPDIFVNEFNDLKSEQVAEDPLEEPVFTASETMSDQNQRASRQPGTISNAQKHARIREERHHLPGHTHNILASYFYYPEKVDFYNKDDEEVVILLVRRHPLTNISWMIIAFVMIMAPAFLSVLPLFDTAPENFRLVFPIIWYMVTIAFILEKFLTWFFNVNIVTDERIIDVDFTNLLYRDISEADIEQIQDVTSRVGGSIRTLFNYGDVVIQTAAEIPEITFEAVPHPDDVIKILRDLRMEEKQEALEGRIR